MGKPKVVYEDGWGGRILLRQHMLNPNILVLQITQPTELHRDHVEEFMNKLTKYMQAFVVDMTEFEQMKMSLFKRKT